MSWALSSPCLPVALSVSSVSLSASLDWKAAVCYWDWKLAYNEESLLPAPSLPEKMPTVRTQDQSMGSTLLRQAGVLEVKVRWEDLAPGQQRHCQRAHVTEQ